MERSEKIWKSDDSNLLIFFLSEGGIISRHFPGEIIFPSLVDWGEKPITAAVTAIGFAVGE